MKLFSKKLRGVALGLVSTGVFALSGVAHAGPFDIAQTQINNWRIALSSPGSNVNLLLTQSWSGYSMTSAGTVDARNNPGFSHPNFFTGAGPTQNGALFTAVAGGARTSNGTAYSRAELREMKAAGGEASWSCTSPRSMTFHGQLISVPAGKQVSIGQIHDASSDSLQVFHKDGRIFARFNDSGSQEHTLVSNYTMGHRYQITIDVNSSGVAVSYKNMSLNSATVTTPRVQLNASSGCYFKSGLYIQFCSVTDMSGKPNTLCGSKPATSQVPTASTLAQARIYSISLSNPQ